MQRVTEHHLFEQEDTFDILFQFLYFFSVGCFMFILLKHFLYLRFISFHHFGMEFTSLCLY